MRLVVRALRTSSLVGLVVAVLVSLMASHGAARDNEVYQKCSNKKDALLADLATFVNIDSGSSDQAGLAKLQGLLIDRFKELGAEVETVPVTKPQVGHSVVATFHGTGQETILLMAHADTVWATGTAEKRPFRMDRTRAYGPGVSDDKGGIVAGLYALTILRELRFQNFERITFLVNPDEETSSVGSRELILELAKRHKYTLCLEPGRANDAVLKWRKGVGHLTMEVFGRNAHAGAAPEKGLNATLELAHQILQLSKLGDAQKMTTINWTVLEQTKTPRNVIPDYAWAMADVRVLYPDEFERLAKDAERIAKNQLVAGTKVKLNLFQARPPFPKNDPTDAMVAHLQAIYAEELGMKLDVQGSGGGSDANFAASAGSITADGLGLVGSGAHTPDEYIELNSIVPRLYLLTRVIMDIGNGKL